VPPEPPRFTDAEIVAVRPERAAVDPLLPYAFFSEPEHSAAGVIEPVSTLFLTNRECLFRCLMCDLWQHTTTTDTPRGAIPAQIRHALERLPLARHIKLYNNGNFFDRRAIPPDDHPAIADLVRDFRTVIVENHPKLCTEDCLRFRDRLNGEFEVALGLETIHPEVLPALNKRMTVDDFDRAAGFLRSNGIELRTFLLLKPPFLDEEAAVEWTLRSLDHAFDQSVRVCSIVPVRAGNGMMEELQRQGLFTPPQLASLERVLAEGLARRRGRVFVDLWDVEKFYDCLDCGPARKARLQAMNLTQQIQPAVACGCGGSAA
jgi:radical SAM enzyme (TIGR01210 family)